MEGAVRPATLLEIARRNDHPLPVDTVEELEALYEFRDLSHFVDVWLLTTNCLRTAADFQQVVVNYVDEVATFGVVYLEAIFSPCERVKRGVSWDELFAGYTDGAQAAFEQYGVAVRLTPDLHREVEVELAEECARQAVRYRDRGVVGLGLGGREAGFPATPYRRAFEIARDGGLGVVPHAGEAAGPESVREVLSMGPARIRHGIRAVEDPDLLAEIVERQIVLDMCLTSNLRLGGVPSLAAHPLPALRDAGVLCTINTDDPAMFGTDLAHEYEMALALGLSAKDAYQAGVVGALCDERTRATLATAGQLPAGR